MRTSRTSPFGPWSALVVVLLAAPVAADGGGSSPVLSVEREAGVSRLWVDVSLPDGGRQRALLRESDASIRPSVTGRDPAGRAAFATWHEGGERWFAYSRDAGRSWSAGRRARSDLRLRDRAVLPGQAMPPVPGGSSLPRDGRLFVVQLRTVSLPEWRNALAESGVEVLRYLPHNAHVVRTRADIQGALASLRDLEFVERIEPFHPWYRLSDGIRAWLDDPDDVRGTMRVRVAALESGPAGKMRIAEAAREIGARIVRYWSNGFIIELEVDRDQLRRIAAHDDVQWIDPWTPAETDMDLVREDAGTDWLEDNFGYCGQGVRGEVLDAGFQTDHPDFDGILLHGSVDVDSHGTSTYGIVFGNGARDGDGDAKGTGHMPCPEAQGIAADFGFLGDRFVHTQELKGDPYFASFQTNSWGDARTRDYTSVSQDMDEIIWKLDFAILQSQSNAGNQDSRPQAWAKNIISVGGIRHKDTLDTADDEWASGASIGPAADGRIKPDIHYWYDNIYTTTTGSGYTSTFGGTSAATPESAGVLGLMIQMWSENVWGTDPEGVTVFERRPHASTMKALLINNAQQYDYVGSDADLSRYKQGWGRPSARIAKERAVDSFVVDHDVALEVGGLTSFDIDVPELESELKITMTFPDPPGLPAAALARINDLDLRVTSPSGTLYHGNVGLTEGTHSVAGGSPDGVDTVENVFVRDPEPGIWKVEIEAVEINEDAHLETSEADAVFSLVVTGGNGSLCDAPIGDFTVTPNPARVGEDVLFDSDVSGGAGGPYTYRWDFDSDGTTDSVAEDPVHVYRRPHEGVAKMRVRDAAGCPETVDRVLSVTGPDLRYEGYVDLLEIQGNGNGAVDPGEVWDLRVSLRNDGNESALGVSADLAIDPATAGSVYLLQPTSTFANIAVGAVESSSVAYRFQVGNDFPCGQDVRFTVTSIRSTEPANTYPEEVAVIAILVGGAGPPMPFFTDGFETDNGWSSSGNGEWQLAAPQGLGGGIGTPGLESKPDPESAFEGARVLGNDLTGLGAFLGRYENDAVSQMLSPIIDASGVVETELEFARWLNVFAPDVAYLDVTPDGNRWTRVYEAAEGHEETSWSLQTLDLSAIADRAPFLRLRFGISADGFGTNSGWNVDAVELSGVTRESCEPFARQFPGEAGELRVDRGAPGEIELRWGADCGGGASYGVYRGDLGVGYDSIAPEPGLCDVAATSVTVPEGAGAADFFVVVPNKDGTEGSYGAGDGTSRPAATGACYPQETLDTCAP